MGDPRIICNYAQLKAMGTQLTWHYKLGQDIDATPSRSEGAASCTAYDPTETDSMNAGHPEHASTCTGWRPVSTFSGSLDGAGFRIRNLYANGHNANNGGLFGEVSGAIRNLGLTQSYIRNPSSAGNRTGALAGVLASGGSISHCYAADASVVGGGDRSGGLVGENSGSITSAYVSDLTLNQVIGVLAGRNESSGSISSSYTDVSLSGTPEGGGLVGRNSGSISNTYAAGSVGAGQSGGLAGFNAGSISNSYAAGLITGTVSGGLVGDNDTGAMITGKNYFADDIGGSDGLAISTVACASTVCIQATGSTDTARQTWLKDSLDETDDSGLNWDALRDGDSRPVWGNLNAAGYPCLRNMPAGAPACP